MLTRRNLLQSASAGFGYLAFAGIANSANAAESPLAPKSSHFPGKAKRVIFLCMQGGPSHVDTFDYKPKLAKDHGKRGKYGGTLMKSPFDFQQHGESGLWVSELFPRVAEHVDDMSMIRSMQCDQPVHRGAMSELHTGTAQFIRPSLGSWTLYGLGTENESLPGYISLNPPVVSANHQGSAFLPAVYSGTKVGGSRLASRFLPPDRMLSVPDIRNPKIDDRRQRMQLDLIQNLNRNKLKREAYQPGVEDIIESYELAFRMQSALPEVMDVSDESASTLAMYGVDGGPADQFAKQCLMARRFAEAGVRFIEISHGNWDQHTNLAADHATRARECDQPIAALLKDLKKRDMLQDTLVVWSGEFGRTPAAQGRDGRNHNNRGYTSWMAGGGVKGGFAYGQTDEHGYEAVDRPCHIHDWHATILHLLGLDHEKLTYRYAGRDFRLTDVYGNVIREILA